MVTWQRRGSLRNSRVMGITALRAALSFFSFPFYRAARCSCSLAGAPLGRLERGYAELRPETVRKGVRVTLRACMWPGYGGQNGRTGRFGCFVGPRFGHLRDFSDGFGRSILGSSLCVEPEQ